MASASRCAIWKALPTVSPHDWGRQAIIVVATIQSFRIEETGLRNVYAFSEAFEPHFRSLPPHRLASLRELPDAIVTPEEAAAPDSPIKGYVGQPKYSLANWLALQRPLIIVDEAHNAQTERKLRGIEAAGPIGNSGIDRHTDREAYQRALSRLRAGACSGKHD